MTLQDIEQWLSTTELPKELRLSKCEYIFDMDKFVKSHLTILKANSGNKAFLPYYERLVKLKEIIENKFA